MPIDSYRAIAAFVRAEAARTSPAPALPRTALPRTAPAEPAPADPRPIRSILRRWMRRRTTSA
ncbi:hypothetical protein ACFO3J_17295 [Streptomyces polygonati]|uniref:Uncharacterized protein n=1 Tax=Streptomyces polygonati TaxID=1617087 RepID=A0ABV8HMI9_9ACTN